MAIKIILEQSILFFLNNNYCLKKEMIKKEVFYEELFLHKYLKYLFEEIYHS